MATLTNIYKKLHCIITSTKLSTRWLQDRIWMGCFQATTVHVIKSWKIKICCIQCHTNLENQEQLVFFQQGVSHSHRLLHDKFVFLFWYDQMMTDMKLLTSIILNNISDFSRFGRNVSGKFSKFLDF